MPCLAVETQSHVPYDRLQLSPSLLFHATNFSCLEEAAVAAFLLGLLKCSFSLNARAFDSVFFTASVDLKPKMHAT